MEEFRSQLQNHLQGIKNQQKQIRLQSLKSLIQNLQTLASSDEKVGSLFEWLNSSNFRTSLLEIAFKDPIDSCREVALQSLINFFLKSSQSQETTIWQTQIIEWLINITPLVKSRIISGMEKREENRVLILQLIQTLIKLLQIQKNATDVDSVKLQTIEKLKQIESQDLVDVLKIALSDSFDEVKKKKEACTLIITLVNKEKSFYEIQKTINSNSRKEILNISRSSVTIIKNILPNIKHKKHQIRSISLDALASLLLEDIPHAKNASSLILMEEIIAMEENYKETKYNTNIFLLFSLLSFDSSPSLRVSLYSYLLSFIQFFTFEENEEETKLKLRSKFLSLLILGLFDSIPSIQSQCLKSMESLGILFLQRNSTEEESPPPILLSLSLSPSLLPPSFTGIKKLLKQSLSSSNYFILFSILHDISDWNSSIRSRAILSLLYYISYTEDAVAPHVAIIIDNLVNAVIKSDSSKKSDNSVHYFENPFLLGKYFNNNTFNTNDINAYNNSYFLIEHISRCCSLMGAYLNPSFYLPHLLSLLSKNPPSLQNIHHIGNILFILCSFLRGIHLYNSNSNSKSSGTLSNTEATSIIHSLLSLDLIFHNLQSDLFKNGNSSLSKIIPEIHFLFLQIYNISSTLLNAIPSNMNDERDPIYRSLHEACLTVHFRLYISSLSSSFHLSSATSSGSSFLDLIMDDLLHYSSSHSYLIPKDIPQCNSTKGSLSRMFTDYLLSVSIPSLFSINCLNTTNTSSDSIHVANDIVTFKLPTKTSEWNDSCLELETLLTSILFSDLETLVNIPFYYSTTDKGNVFVVSLIVDSLCDLCSSSSFPVRTSKRSLKILSNIITNDQLLIKYSEENSTIKDQKLVNITELVNSSFQKAVVTNLIWNSSSLSVPTRLEASSLVLNFLISSARIAEKYPIIKNLVYNLLQIQFSRSPSKFQSPNIPGNVEESKNVEPTILTLLKALNNLLDDFDSNVRLKIVASFDILFTLCENLLQDHEIELLIPNILKRMEDGDDKVRIAVSHALSSYSKFIDKNKEKMDFLKVENIAKEMIIHMDDQNKEVQNAACNTITELIKISKGNSLFSKIIENVEQSRKKHQSPHLCDFILQFAASI